MKLDYNKNSIKYVVATDRTWPSLTFLFNCVKFNLHLANLLYKMRSAFYFVEIKARPQLILYSQLTALLQASAGGQSQLQTKVLHTRHC